MKSILVALIVSSPFISLASASSPILIGGEKLTCRFSSMNDFGYILSRISETEVAVEVISRGVPEGEKTKFIAQEKKLGVSEEIYLVNFKRYDIYGNYIEFRIAPNKSDPTRFFGFVMFTESLFRKGPNGEEKEEFTPLAKKFVVCVK